MPQVIGRETSVQRAVAQALERIMERADELSMSPEGERTLAGIRPDLRELRDEAHAALLKIRTEFEPSVQAVRGADVEKVEGDARGALVFLKNEDGGAARVLLLAPDVVRLANNAVSRTQP